MKKKHKKRKHHWSLLSKIQLAAALGSGLVLVVSRTPWSHNIIRSHGLVLTVLAALHIAEQILAARKGD